MTNDDRIRKLEAVADAATWLVRAETKEACTDMARLATPEWLSIRNDVSNAKDALRRAVRDLNGGSLLGVRGSIDTMGSP